MPPRPRKPTKKPAAKKPAGKKKHTPPPPSAVTPERVEMVLRVRLDGAQFHDVRGFANDTDADGKADAARGGPAWNVTDDDVWQLIDRADALTVSRAEQNRARAYAMAVARREALYARALSAGDYSAALACLRDIAQLQGTYPKVAELVKVIKEQAATLTELEADRDRPRLTDGNGEEAGAEGPPGEAVAGGEAEGDEAGG
ncbi:MAG TPA: hypothetical protein VD866_08120 [Urbifossiella sp.]|nr:hypothetical protein [Urbifossiella sp.]